MTIDEKWEQEISKEIIELHEFFQNWFNGTIPKGEFSRFRDVMDQDFKIISPVGDLTEKTELCKMLESSYGKNTKFQISIRNIIVQPICSDNYLAVYEEIQQQGLEISSRISSALFRKNEKLVNNYAWLHVHETWM